MTVTEAESLSSCCLALIPERLVGMEATWQVRGERLLLPLGELGDSGMGGICIKIGTPLQASLS